jgi:hypothetical protein
MMPITNYSGFNSHAQASILWRPGLQVQVRSGETFTIASVDAHGPQLYAVSLPHDRLGFHPNCRSLDIVAVGG